MATVSSFDMISTGPARVARRRAHPATSSSIDHPFHGSAGRSGRTLTSRDLAAIPLPKTRDAIKKLQTIEPTKPNRLPPLVLIGGGGVTAVVAAGLSWMILQTSPDSPLPQPEIASSVQTTPPALASDTMQSKGESLNEVPDSLSTTSVAAPVSQLATAPTVPKPSVGLSVPTLATPQTGIDQPDLPRFASAIPRLTLPAKPTQATAPDAFDCRDCLHTLLDLTGITVRATSADDGVLARLTTAKATVLLQDAGPVPAVQNQIRFYHSADAPIAAALATQLDAVVIDLSWVTSEIPLNTVEVLMEAHHRTD